MPKRRCELEPIIAQADADFDGALSGRLAINLSPSNG
jgi:hypothetical protein